MFVCGFIRQVRKAGQGTRFEKAPLMIRPPQLLILAFAAMLSVPALAQESGGFLGQMGQPIDTSAPIEIAADALEVLQTEQVAIFSGNVDATQGDMRLQASSIRVHYNSGSGTGGEISRIDAEGDVHVSSATETARGDNAIYDVEAEEVRMQGNVVLTQGSNVIQGDRLTIDLASGHSRIEGGASMVTETNEGGRVRGVFTIPSNTDGESDGGDSGESGSGTESEGAE
jgi:lipopolysaccharide export system protein LptA